MSRDLGLTETDRIRVQTVISELAHNLLLHGGGGAMTLETISQDSRRGLKICAHDAGPGIRDIDQALQDGFSTRKSLGSNMIPLTVLSSDHESRIARDRNELLSAIISAPGFDALFRADVIHIPGNHPIFGWACGV